MSDSLIGAISRFGAKVSILGGSVDIVAVELQRAALHRPIFLIKLYSLSSRHRVDQIEVGTAVLIVGFPWEFHDNLHHLHGGAPSGDRVGVRYSFPKGQGYFLTDARMHRGTSGRRLSRA